MAIHDELRRALDLAAAGKWDDAHAIVQLHEHDVTACWLHAVLHKIEQDEGNARYWYRRSGGHVYEDYEDARAELAAIRAAVAA
jgi:hypothetical protein